MRLWWWWFSWSYMDDGSISSWTTILQLLWWEGSHSIFCRRIWFVLHLSTYWFSGFCLSDSSILICELNSHTLDYFNIFFPPSKNTFLFYNSSTFFSKQISYCFSWNQVGISSSILDSFVPIEAFLMIHCDHLLRPKVVLCSKPIVGHLPIRGFSWTHSGLSYAHSGLFCAHSGLFCAHSGLCCDP